MLAKLLGSVQKPGALKLLLAVGAITWGTSAVMKIAHEAQEVAQAAEDHYVRRMAELAELDAMIGRAENRITVLKKELQDQARAEASEPAGENID